jgi:hypothetical protein
MPNLIILDSSTQSKPEHAGCILVCGSHGGVTAARFAAAVAPRAAVFNDAGGGLDAAGYSGLAWLDERGIAGATVAHTSARIGEGQSTYQTGIITQVNAKAAQLGARVGMLCAAWCALLKNN